MGPEFKRGSSKPHAASWSTDEIAFAEKMIAWWKECAKAGNTPTAFRVRRNRFVAIQFYRWLCSPENCDPKMTEDDVRIAMKAYAEADYNRRKGEGRYLDFQDWFRRCPDIVAKEIKRIGKTLGNDTLKDQATAVVRWNNWGAAASMATKNQQVLFEYVRDQYQVVCRDPLLTDFAGVVKGKQPGETRVLYERAAQRGRHEQWLNFLWHVLQAYQQLKKDEVINLMARASLCFEAYCGRAHSYKSLKDLNLRVAMACSLFGRYGKSKLTPPPAAKGGA